ncbi:MAG: phage holin family protein [Actinomycetota bacterium]|nr:phage holin family protein [Actinomycetota bacterium]
MTEPAHHLPEEMSTAQLLERLTEQTSLLVRQEVQHATAEMKEKGTRLGIGLGLSGAGAVVALFGVGALVAAAVLALDLVLAAWLAALIVGVVIVAVGALLALVGVQRARAAVPPMPEDTMASVQRDVQTVKENVK